MSMQVVTDLFKKNELDAALQEVQAVIKNDPTDQAYRLTYAEILCIQGDLEKADKQLEVVVKQAPKNVMELLNWRQLIRAEQKRQDWFQQGAVPTFLEKNERLETLLRVGVELRSNNIEEAEKLIASLEEGRPTVDVVYGDNQQATELRDLDDTCSDFVEVLTSKGDYYWITFDQLLSIEFEEPQRFLDTIWRRATIHTTTGIDGVVFIPAIYANSESVSEKMGTTTDWTALSENLYCGKGQKIWLFGEQDIPLMELTSITFNHDSA